MMLKYLTITYLVHSTQLVNYTQLTMLILPSWYCQKQLFCAYSLPILLLLFFLNYTLYCHFAYLTYMQSTSFKMPDWMKHKLESRLLGEISVTSDMQMTPPLWQKA